MFVVSFHDVNICNKQRKRKRLDTVIPPPCLAHSRGMLAYQVVRRSPETAPAEEWRERGNARFKAGDYAGAREAYTASIAASATCLAYANRAMAALKTGDAAAADADCTAAIALDATYLKAYQRRAAARQLLGRRLEVCAVTAIICDVPCFVDKQCIHGRTSVHSNLQHAAHGVLHGAQLCSVCTVMPIRCPDVCWLSLAARSMPRSWEAQGIEDLETAVRLQPTSAALAKDCAAAIAALMAEEGLKPPSAAVRMPVTVAGDGPLPARLHAVVAADHDTAQLCPSASRQLKANSSGIGSGAGGADQDVAKCANTGPVAVKSSSLRKGVLLSAGDAMPMEQLGLMSAALPAPGAAMAVDSRSSPAQPDHPLESAAAQNGRHVLSPSAMSPERPEQIKAESEQPADSSTLTTAQPSAGAVPQPAAVPIITAATQSARTAALRPAASGAAPLPLMPSEVC